MNLRSHIGFGTQSISAALRWAASICFLIETSGKHAPAVIIRQAHVQVCNCEVSQPSRGICFVKLSHSQGCQALIPINYATNSIHTAIIEEKASSTDELVRLRESKKAPSGPSTNKHPSVPTLMGQTSSAALRTCERMYKHTNNRPRRLQIAECD